MAEYKRLNWVFLENIRIPNEIDWLDMYEIFYLILQEYLECSV
jgi:hypothetical protein